MKRFIAIFLLFLAFAPAGVASSLKGGDLSLMWTIPFGGLLLSLALLPIFAEKWWHQHMGKVALLWSGFIIVGLSSKFSPSIAIGEMAKVIFHEYVPFVIFIGALYTIGGGIHISVKGRVAPLMNVMILTGGTVLASLIGTTGAAMLLIRPIIKLNHFRTNRQHVVIFFIFLVANVGGSLTPLGDPPLFLGFLNGVSFFWPAQHLMMPFLMTALPLLVIFWVLDHYYFYHDPHVKDPEHFEEKFRIHVKGKMNVILLVCVAGIVLLNGLCAKSPSFSLYGIDFKVADLLRDIGLIGVAYLSYKKTPYDIYEENEFSWEPLLEVSKLFAGIFITLIPVASILASGTEGAMASLFHFANPGGSPFPFFYYWMTGILSAFLDNAPTYLVFFYMAGGNAEVLMNQLSMTLAAISAGAVFMGAMTYIGNAPNFMVRSIAVRSRIRMPGFFGYMAWSFGILLPLFFIMSWLWFR